MSANELVRGGGGGSSSGVVDVDYPEGVFTISETQESMGGIGPVPDTEVAFTVTAEVDPESGTMSLEYRTDGELGITVQRFVRELVGEGGRPPMNVVARFDTSDFGVLADIQDQMDQATQIDDPVTRRVFESVIDDNPILSRGLEGYRELANINEEPINTRLSPSAPDFLSLIPGIGDDPELDPRGQDQDEFFGDDPRNC